MSDYYNSLNINGEGSGENKQKRSVIYDGLSGNEPKKPTVNDGGVSKTVNKAKDKLTEVVNSDAVSKAAEEAKEKANELKNEARGIVNDVKSGNGLSSQQKKFILIAAAVVLALIIVVALFSQPKPDPYYYEDFGVYEESYDGYEGYDSYDDGYYDSFGD